MLGGIESRLSRLAGPTHAMLRIGAALLFMQHGVMKLGMLGGIDGSGGTVELMSRMGLAAGIETIGATLILVGFLTRPIALLAFVEMLAAFWIAHLPQGGFPIQNGGEVPLLFALVWLFLVGNGAGPFSVDAARRRRRDSGLLAAR
jgi:putative oxidoreductase